ncbi:MAG TPA: DNA-protecting protein DprA [Polyangium sp.]|nr:DNA-protecting protein DprA [Polyangium sp.]
MCTTHVLHPDHPSYPSALGVLATPDKPPPTLYLRGSLPEDTPIAIVGRRAASAEAIAFTRSLVFDLADAGVSIWSGGAIGVDGAAHVAALEAGIPTVVIMGAGLDCPYPPEHVRLYERILEAGGGLLSRLPNDFPPRPFNFLARNHVLAAITCATVVIEAGIRSGARSTAASARRLGRPLCVVPHAPWSEGGAGCAQELADGARAITSAADVLAAIGHDALPRRTSARNAPSGSGQTRLSFSLEMKEVPKRSRTKVRQSEPLPIVELGPLEQAIQRVMSDEPMHIDVICERVESSLPAVVGALLTLTLQMLVAEGPAGCYRKVKR